MLTILYNLPYQQKSSRKMSARSHSLHSVCPQISFSFHPVCCMCGCSVYGTLLKPCQGCLMASISIYFSYFWVEKKRNFGTHAMQCVAVSAHRPTQVLKILLHNKIHGNISGCFVIFSSRIWNWKLLNYDVYMIMSNSSGYSLVSLQKAIAQ